LVPQAVDQLSIPVIGAGGLMDGRGVLSTLVLDAEAVQMGTAFVTCTERGAKPQHKAAILNRTADDTTVSPVFSGKPARGIRNEFMKEMEKCASDVPAYPLQNMLTKEIRSEAAKQNRPDMMSLWSGQNPGGKHPFSANELMTSIIEQVDEIMKKKW